jgi:hypothetical protein
MIGTVVTILSMLAGAVPKAAAALGLTSPAAISNDVTAVFTVIGLLAGLFTAVSRAKAGVQPLTLTQAAADIHPATKAASGQAGFVRVSLLALLAGFGCAALLVACATTSVQTFYQLELTAGTLNDTAINTLDTLVRNKAITGMQASAALQITDAVQAAIVTANNAYQAGNQATANSDLVAISATLTAVQTCLVKPATFTTCLAGVPTP